MEKEVRLIDADKLKQHYAWWEIGDGEITYAEAKKRFDTIIDVQPTVDAVSVVRCSECKYCDRGNCDFWDDGYGAIVSMTDFCSQGERKDDAEEE